MSKFVNFIQTNFIKMSLFCFKGLLYSNHGLWVDKTNCLKFPPDICSLPSAILNPMNLPSAGLVWWFNESRFGFRKSGPTHTKDFETGFSFGPIKQGLRCPRYPCQTCSSSVTWRIQGVSGKYKATHVQPPSPSPEKTQTDAKCKWHVINSISWTDVRKHFSDVV